MQQTTKREPHATAMIGERGEKVVSTTCYLQRYHCISLIIFAHKYIVLLSSNQTYLKRRIKIVNLSITNLATIKERPRDSRCLKY